MTPPSKEPITPPPSSPAPNGAFHEWWSTLTAAYQERVRAKARLEGCTLWRAARILHSGEGR